MGPCLFTHQLFFSADEDAVVDGRWLMEARKIGKRLVSLDLPARIQLSDETHEVICGVAGCVAKRKKIRRIIE